LLSLQACRSLQPRPVIYGEKAHVVEDQAVDCIGILHLNIYNFHSTDDFGGEYSGSETWNYSFHVAANGRYPQEGTFIHNLTGISHGSGPNLLFKYRFRVTIAAPGQATVQREILSVECIPEKDESPRPIDLTVEVEDTGGRTGRLPLGRFRLLQPQVEAQVAKAAWLSDEKPSELVDRTDKGVVVLDDLAIR
jgi:hypothetical protein